MAGASREPLTSRRATGLKALPEALSYIQDTVQQVPEQVAAPGSQSQ